MSKITRIESAMVKSQELRGRALEDIAMLLGHAGAQIVQEAVLTAAKADQDGGPTDHYFARKQALIDLDLPGIQATITVGIHEELEPQEDGRLVWKQATTHQKTPSIILPGRP